MTYSRIATAHRWFNPIHQLCQCAPHLINGSLNPPDSVSQTASQSVKPFSAQVMADCPMPYNGPPLPPQNCPFTWRIWTPIEYMVPWAHLSPHPKRHLDWFSRFRRAHDRNRQTDRLTDLATPSVATGCSYVVLRCSLIITYINYKPSSMLVTIPYM